MTILYKSDFAKYPSAIIDLKTKNTSWLEFGAKLRKEGNENWGFHLTLLDPTLQGVDYFADDLDRLTILKIQTELRNNYWFYLREFFKVPTGGSGGSVYYRANRGNIGAAWSLFNSFVTYVEQIRQTGKSLFTRGIATGFHNAWTENSTHILFTKSDLRADEIKSYREISEELPGYVRYKHKKDKENQQEFTTMCHSNVTYSYIPQGDPKSANKVGRGKTPRFINGDEIPFLAYAQISIPALEASTNNSFDEAKAAGDFYGTLWTTTAGDLSTDEGKYVYEKIRKKGMFFTEALYDCENREEAVAMIVAHSESTVVPHVVVAFNHRQLGYTDEWLMEKIDRNTGTKDAIKRDLLGIWTFGSAANPIPERVMLRIRKAVNEVPQVETMARYYTVRFQRDVEYVRKRQVVMGLDTSDLIGRDAITGVGVDVITGEVLFAFGLNESNLTHFTSFLAQFLRDFPKVVMIPEAKSSWSGIRDQLLISLPEMGIDPGKRIYSRVVDESLGSESQQKEYREFSSGHPSERKYYPYRKLFGFMTGPASRETLTRDVLMKVVDEYAELIRDSVLIDELSTLVERKGRIDHALSGHDDHVISFALAHWLLRFGRNLQHYGIDPNTVLSRRPIRKDTVQLPPKEQRRQDRIHAELEKCYDKIQKSTSVIEQKYLSRRIDMLERDIRNDDDIENRSSSLDGQQADARKEAILKRAKDGPGGFIGGLLGRR